MTNAWESDNCEQLRSHFAYYAVPQAAMLWCGVPPEDVDSEFKNATPHPAIRGVWSHPYIRCLEPRCRVIQDAINSGALPCSRENGKPVAASDRVAVERRHVSRDDLKDWIAHQFPADKPAFLFDEIERSTHTSINADSFRALQADLNARNARLEKATEVYRKLKQEKDALESERDSLRAMVDKIAAPGDRAEAPYLTIIGAMLELVRSPRAGRDSDAAVIRELIENYSDKPGISKTTLEARFADARRRLNST
ncbi:MAG: hypothetical protein CFE44_15995 [Burkholderiales bacterium PBB4]|nr:MAG: hypothetical protein CFE44_15995 [Burkholderiales bacterium PBB4]